MRTLLIALISSAAMALSPAVFANEPAQNPQTPGQQTTQTQLPQGQTPPANGVLTPGGAAGIDAAILGGTIPTLSVAVPAGVVAATTIGFIVAEEDDDANTTTTTTTTTTTSTSTTN